MPLGCINRGSPGPGRLFPLRLTAGLGRRTGGYQSKGPMGRSGQLGSRGPSPRAHFHRVSASAACEPWIRACSRARTRRACRPGRRQEHRVHSGGRVASVGPAGPHPPGRSGGRLPVLFRGARTRPASGPHPARNNFSRMIFQRKIKRMFQFLSTSGCFAAHTFLIISFVNRKIIFYDM